MFGLLNINKPVGPTSHDVVAAARRRLGRGVKVGHAGTLDPFADGVLVLCVGAATRLAGYVQARPKRYLATVRLGATSSTDDSEGEITAADAASPPAASAVEEVLREFVGTIEQIPPAHSAVHVGGRRAYQLARAGEQLDLPPRTVTVHSIELMSYDYPLLAVEVACGTGTYIRAIARDVGEAIGVGGYCERLTRTAVGAFGIEEAIRPDQLDPAEHLLPPTLALEHLPRIEAGPDWLGRIANGSRVALHAPHAPGEVAVLAPTGQLIALATVAPDGRTLRPVKVFISSA